MFLCQSDASYEPFGSSSFSTVDCTSDECSTLSRVLETSLYAFRATGGAGVAGCVGQQVTDTPLPKTDPYCAYYALASPQFATSPFELDLPALDASFGNVVADFIRAQAWLSAGEGTPQQPQLLPLYFGSVLLNVPHLTTCPLFPTCA